MMFPAQIVFLESQRVDRPKRWIGHLLRPSAAIDRETGKPILTDPIFEIEERPDGSCRCTMQGGSRHGRRYATHPSVTEAQEAGIRWARRRFYVTDERTRP